MLTWIPFSPCAATSLASMAVATVPALTVPAEQAPAVDLSGRWLCYKPRAGRIELDRFLIDVQVHDDGSIEGVLEIPDRTVALSGYLDDDRSALLLSATADGRTARLELAPAEEGAGGGLVGTLDQWGTSYQVTAERATPEGEATLAFSETTSVEVQFPIELPEAVTVEGLAFDVENRLREEVLELMVLERAVGLSLVVVREGAIIDLRSFGWEDYHGGIPASEQTRYRWASVVKPLTSAVALCLAEQGTLDLDVSVRAHVPEWPERWSDITSNMLMTHQSGIVHYKGMQPRTLREYEVPHPWEDTITALDMFTASELRFLPGQSFAYSTPGFVLLGAVIERAGGAPYSEIVRDLVCEPLGLRTLRPDRIGETVEHRAVGYGHGRNGGIFVATQDDISWKTPAGGWISTVGDLGLFVAGLMGSDLLEEETRRDMWTERRTVSGERTGFGLGVQVPRLDGELALSHAGGQLGASAYFAALPGEQLGVAILCNTEATPLSDLTFELLRLCR